MAVRRQDILTEARTYVGVRWRHQGRSRTGLDCGGLIIVVAKTLGLFDVTWRTYRREADGVTLERACLEVFDPLPSLAAVRPGDVLMLDCHQRYPCHLALVGDLGTPFSLVHAVAQYRKVVEQRFEASWRAEVRRVFSFRGIQPWEGPWPV